MRDCEHCLLPQKVYINPTKVGLQFVQYLKNHPDSTNDRLSQIVDISKARVCQIVAFTTDCLPR